MPAIGDQHKSNGGASANPFEEEQPRISEYTAQEIATLQSRLDKQLGPEYISSRPGAAGQKVHYLAAEKVINLANQVFGFNGWSSAIKIITIDFIDENPHTGKISLGLSVIVRVTLRDGTYHEDIGYGHIENCKGKAAAFEKAKKEGTTDALKRALRTFGNVLGNCIYDKDFLGKVIKIKVAPSKWDADNLHRHPDFAPEKKVVQENSSNTVDHENGSGSHTDGDDEFGGADFSDADFSEHHNGHPDEVMLPAEPQLPPPPARPTGVTPTLNQPLVHTKPAGPQTNGGSNTPSRHLQSGMAPSQPAARIEQLAPRPQPTTDLKADANSGRRPLSPGHPPKQLTTAQSGAYQAQDQNPPQLPAQNQPPSVGFYSARAAPALNGAPDGDTAPVSGFNPHSESPSIRKTVGIDHSRSLPVKRATMDGAEKGSLPPPISREGVPAVPAPARDFVNPSSDTHRRIGAPGGCGMQSPAAKGGMNGSAYRPPSRRGPIDTNAGMIASVPQAQSPGPNPGTGGTKRPPLGNVSNLQPSMNGAQGAGAGDDAKRQRTTGPENPAPPPLPQQQQQQQSLPGIR